MNESDNLSISYEDAFKELKEISLSIESENVSLDALAAKVERASTLIKVCQSKLRAAESEINSIIHNLGNEE